MSKSPHRFRGDARECWTTVLTGQVLRALDAPAVVRDEACVKLPRSGHWETGLARMRPALDDALGSTAFAVAWRWACAEVGANAWPGLPRVARQATDQAIEVAGLSGFARVGAIEIDANAYGSGRKWIASLPDGEAVVRVSEAPGRNWQSVDRLADVLAAWLDVPWRIDG